MSDSKELLILEDFTGILEQLGIAYAIGGSLASSIYGKVRFTQDADITVEPFESRAENLFERLKPSYYISQEAMYEALKRHSSFNIIHYESAFKIDVFISGSTTFEKQLMSRKKQVKLSGSMEKLFLVVSPEDIILLKLQWYRDSGFSSERQWEDVLGILEVQADRLDYEYMKKWSAILGINELLEKASSEVE